jgi:hypothetical protein
MGDYMTADDLIDRIERAYVAARTANLTIIRLEVSHGEYAELSRLYGVPDGIRFYRGRPVAIAAGMRWVTD